MVLPEILATTLKCCTFTLNGHNIREMMRTIGICMLTVLGLLGTIALAVGSPTLERFAHASLASPVLIVYSERGEQARYRIMSSRFSLKLTDTSGTTRSVILDRKAYNKMVAHFNPLSRHIVTLPYFASLVLHADPTIDVELRSTVLQYGFCGTGPMSHAMGIDLPITEISVEMVSNERQLEPPSALIIACTK